jgi:hypothetical protein
LSSEVAERTPPGVPRWIKSSLHLTAGRDPIGLQTITIDRIMPRLVPAILALSQRARYLSFHSFLLLEYEERKLVATNRALSGFIKAKEFEFALAVQLCPRCPSVRSGAVGNRRAGPAINSSGSELPRGESVQSELGGYGLYYRSPLIDLGVVAPVGSTLSDEGVTPVDVLTPGLGRDLGATFRNTIASTDYYHHYMYSDAPIPRAVLREFAAVACLCRLPDFPEEQALIRQILFADSPLQPTRDIDQRRRSFALFLWLSQHAPTAVDLDAEFRRVIWDSFGEQQTDASSIAETLGQWAALVAKEYIQEALSTLWAATCREGRRRQSPDGMTAAEFERFIHEDLVGSGTLTLPGGEVAFDSDMSTRSFASAVIASTRHVAPEDLRAFFTEQDTAVAGVALLLAILERLPAPEGAAKGWREIALQRSTWQPSVLQLAQQFNVHLESDPALRDTTAWLVRQRVVATHERVAYSKLPEFTFRFRWENDRLRFYSWFEPERFYLTDIRRAALSRLSEDIGLWHRSEDGTPQLSNVGQQFVQEVFG